MSKKRKWSEDYYVKHGCFTSLTETDGTKRPQRKMCSKVLSNANLEPSKLKEPFDNRHGGANTLI